MDNGLVLAAKKYVGMGLSVLPADDEKEPIIKWKKLQQTIMTDDEIEASFSSSNATMLAIITGKVSGNIEVIDVDSHNDPSGSLWNNYRTLIEEELPDVFSKLLIVQSMHGGYHLYYRCEEIGRNVKLAKKQIESKDQKDTLIETRAEGGYIIAPPTEGYTFIQSDYESIPTITKAERILLLSIARSFDERVPEINEKETKQNGKNKNELEARFDLGNNTNDGRSTFEQYNAEADVVALLEKHDWSVVSTDGDRVYFKRPGETSNKKSANYHTGLKVFHAFTSSTAFDPERGYNPVQIYALLECDNDLSIASKTLYEQGYGREISLSPDQEQNERKTQRIDFSTLLQPPTEDAIRARLKLKPKSITTSFIIGGEELRLPAGAITIVAAATSHGKSTVLQNIALDVAKNKSIYYFGYEEDTDAILINTLNSYIGSELSEAISANARRTVRSYLRSGKTIYIKDDGYAHPDQASNQLNADAFLAAKDKFFAERIENGRFGIRNVNYNSTDLVNAIRYLRYNTDVAAIFIDYIQLLDAGNSKRGMSRQGEVKQICLELKDVAIETGLPIILGAQFNRNVMSKKDLALTNIGEAGDIERVANLVLGLWNEAFSNKDESDDSTGLYVKVLKNREGKAGLNETFDFDGNRGIISNRIVAEEKIIQGFS